MNVNFSSALSTGGLRLEAQKEGNAQDFIRSGFK